MNGLLLVMALALSGPAVAASPEAQGGPDVRVEDPCMGPVLRSVNDNPWRWQAVERALRAAGISRRIIAICPRPTELWTAHVVVEPVEKQPQLRAVVSFGDPEWSVLCVTSELDGCRKYGKLVSPEVLGWLDSGSD